MGRWTEGLSNKEVIPRVDNKEVIPRLFTLYQDFGSPEVFAFCVENPDLLDATTACWVRLWRGLPLIVKDLQATMDRGNHSFEPPYKARLQKLLEGTPGRESWAANRLSKRYQ
ncbi:hypothetical protein HKX48_007599 [Thoreauomyces humboldtii]|nr:hypothetical protein HKX48_007599 [Thoreauomyces humboldtii]